MCLSKDARVDAKIKKHHARWLKTQKWRLYVQLLEKNFQFELKKEDEQEAQDEAESSPLVEKESSERMSIIQIPSRSEGRYLFKRQRQVDRMNIDCGQRNTLLDVFGKHKSNPFLCNMENQPLDQCIVSWFERLGRFVYCTGQEGENEMDVGSQSQSPKSLSGKLMQS